MKAIDTYRFNYTWFGTPYSTPERASKREAMRDMWPLIEKHDGRYLTMTLERITRYVKEEGEQ